MTEAQVQKSFTYRVKRNWPQAFIYKIPDTGGLGGMRPFDTIAIIDGLTFCIEFKRDYKQEVTKYQIYSLGLASKNGAYSYVVYPENIKEILSKIWGAIEWKRWEKNLVRENKSQIFLPKSQSTSISERSLIMKKGNSKS